jgi:hypothetical protein
MWWLWRMRERVTHTAFARAKILIHRVAALAHLEVSVQPRKFIDGLQN